MSIRAFDRAQDAYNLAKKKPVQQKVMVFIVPSKVKLGVVKTEVRFPYSGKIVDFYASCGVVGGGRTTLRLEKCSQEDYDTTPIWNNVFSTDATIDANEKSTRTSETAFVIEDDYVAVNDHFRINVTEVGGGVEDITVEVVVQI